MEMKFKIVQQHSELDYIRILEQAKKENWTVVNCGINRGYGWPWDYWAILAKDM